MLQPNNGMNRDPKSVHFRARSSFREPVSEKKVVWHILLGRVMPDVRHGQAAELSGVR